MTSVVDQPLTGELSAAAQAVGSQLIGAAPLGVAFSGGVDSSVLLALAVRALGADHVVAILGVSPSLGSDDRLAAHEVAASIGARLVEVQTREADNPAYRANGPDRCFHCKNELFTRIADEVAGAYSLAAVAYGENADDAMRPDRPGSRAATSHKVLRPLADAGLALVIRCTLRISSRRFGRSRAHRTGGVRPHRPPQQPGGLRRGGSRAGLPAGRGRDPGRPARSRSEPPGPGLVLWRGGGAHPAVAAART